METVSARDAKFLVSCVVSSIDGTGKGDAAGSLGVLLSTLPHTFQVRQSSEMLRPVWQEAVTHVLRVKNGRTHRKQLLKALLQATEIEVQHDGNPLSDYCPPSRNAPVAIDFDTVESNDKQTIFSRACREGDAELVKILIHSKADLGVTTFTRTQSDGTNALQQATARGHVDVVGLLCTLPNDDILAAFEAKVPGKGNVLEIAEALNKTAIAHMLLDRVPWLTSAVEPTRAASFVAQDIDELNSSTDLLAFVKEIPDSAFFDETCPSPLGNSDPSPIPIHAPTPLEIAAQTLHTTTTPWTVALQALISVFPATLRRNAHTAAVEGLSHDDAQVMLKLFKRSQPLKEVGETQLVRDTARLVATARSVMQEYLRLPKHRDAAPPGPRPTPNAELAGFNQCVDLAQSHPIEMIVEHTITLAPAHHVRAKDLARRIPLHSVTSLLSTDSLNAAFGMGGGDQAPMPSRVQRFLGIVEAAMAKTEDSAARIRLGHLAFADDWLLGALRISGMFPVVMSAAFSPAAIAANPDLRMLAEATTDSSSPPPLLGRVLQFALMVLQHLLPAEQPDAVHVRDMLLSKMATSDAIKYITLAQGAAKVSPLSSSVNTKGEASFVNGQAYAFNVRILTTRLFALHTITELYQHRDVVFLTAPTSRDQSFEGSTLSWDRPPTSELLRNTPGLGNCYRAENVLRGHESCAVPCAALLWLGSRTFCELDAVEILFSATRVQALAWLASVVSTACAQTTQGPCYLADQPWWPALASGVVTPVEDVLYFRTRPCAKLFHARGSPPQALHELLNAFLSRAAATGDCTLLQRALAPKDGIDAQALLPQPANGPIGWQLSACGLSPLMLAILCGQRPAVEFLVQCARTAKSGGKELLQTCVAGLSASSAAVDSLWISRHIGDAEATMALVSAFESLM